MYRDLQLWISPICELYWYSGTPVSDHRFFSSYEVRLALDNSHIGYRLPRGPGPSSLFLNGPELLVSTVGR